jgi:Predicted membrane protein involved in D-alanine export
MLFSSTIFLFIFLPVVLGLYYTLLRKYVILQNFLLLIASLLFYAWGEPHFVFAMLFSILMNYFFSKEIGISSLQLRRFWMIISVLFNIGVLCIFKYLNFIIDNLNRLFGDVLPKANISLPIGISFFTFQAMSYVIDVYKEKVKPQSLFNVALYISFFPQLVAGPIVRYEVIGDKLYSREYSIEQITEGIEKFIIGLGKKVIISNQMALVADTAFNAVSSGEDISIVFSWLGAFAYTLQIYFDFDGYSQMAIGLGKMFGFDFPENFDYPYIAKSITEFWRRWHISLSTWFRDYLYIPLGGSRVDSTGKHIRNLLIVWLATGIWHGANWTFVLWGFIYFVLLVFEKYTSVYRCVQKTPIFIQQIYTMFFVIMAWVLFRAETLTLAKDYLFNMLGKSNIFVDRYAIEYIGEYKIFFIFAILYSLAVFKHIKERAEKRVGLQRIIYVLTPVTCILIFAISVTYLVTGGYNPFIYFNF